MYLTVHLPKESLKYKVLIKSYHQQICFRVFFSQMYMTVN